MSFSISISSGSHGSSEESSWRRASYNNPLEFAQRLCHHLREYEEKHDENVRQLSDRERDVLWLADYVRHNYFDQNVTTRLESLEDGIYQIRKEGEKISRLRVDWIMEVANDIDDFDSGNYSAHRLVELMRKYPGEEAWKQQLEDLDPRQISRTISSIAIEIRATKDQLGLY